MLTALPALLLLFGFPHFGLKPRRVASPADSLPPAWKSVSRLALEDQFVLATLRPLRLHPPGLRLSLDPRALRVTMDPDSGTVSTSTRLGEIPLGPGATRSLSEFSRETGRLTFERLWLESTQRSLNVKGAGSGGGAATTGLSFKLPSPLPARVQSLLGPGGPALNVSGSENIRLSGQSDWSNQQMTQLGQRRSLFPTLNMQQDLNIRLEGQLSDRIKVNLLQNSANQIPLANRIAINYRGGEDDLVQALDLGNTSLTLPGTQYVSYSGRNEGLFGVKTTLRYGPLDFTVLASKQEGKSERASYTGGASTQNQTLNDYDYVRGVYFFLYDPNTPTLDIEDASIVLYRDNGDYTTNVSTVRGRALMDPTRGPGTGSDTAAVLGYFTQLTAGADKDYEILRDVYGPNWKVIRLRRQMTGDQRLGVTYRARPASGGQTQQVGSVVPVDDPDGVPTIQMKLLRAPAILLVPDAAGGFAGDTLFNATRELELKNFYQLGGQRIDPTSIKIDIRQGVTDPPVYSVSAPSGERVPYIEMLGLDNFDESGGLAVRGHHDNKVDGTALGTNTRSFVDYENGVLFLPDLRPFAPRLGPGEKPFDQAVSVLLSRRDSLVGAPYTSAAQPALNASNPAIYDDYNPRRDLVSSYFIDVEFKAAQAQGEIVLGRGNLLENSEVVQVGGDTWVRDKDYTIDYDLGRLTLKRQVPPGAQLNVNYSYAPLFQQAGRTLVGSAFRLEGREKSFGGAFMYESKGAQDLRPRLGEEPSRSLITDLNTEWTFHPGWATRLVDRLPGIRTTAPSDFHVQAELGMSFPNPNTRNEVFIDDMEGVRDAVSLNMTQERWHWASVPRIEIAAGQSVALIDTVGGLALSDTLHNAEVHWFSPPSFVKERDLKPNLNDAQGARNPHEVLCLSVPRRPKEAISDSTRLWAGVDYTLDQQGLDLSRSQFIELWVNDFRDQHAGDGVGRVRGRHVRLHVDLGTMSEDQMRAPDELPNGRLDTEDKAHDNVLTVDTDTGLDGVPTRDERTVRDLVTAGDGDPEGDNWGAPNEAVTKDPETKAIDPRYWVSVNGTEGNRTINPLPDTEDQNLNGALDLNNNYTEYTIDLGGDSPYLVTDVYNDFHANYAVAPDNGWRRYRIPIDDSLAVKFGSPNRALVQRVRVWLQGIVEPDPAGLAIGRPLLMLGGLDIVGSRWQQAAFDSISLAAPVTTMTLNSVNSLDNADVYVPPFDPGQTRNGSQELTRREQSMSLEFTDLKPGATLETFKTFSLDENYSRYGKLSWYAAAFDLHDASGVRCDSTPGLFYFVRFASDEQGRNYYEYRASLPANSQPRQISWNEIRLQLTDLSNLKLRSDFQKADPNRYGVAGAASGESLFVVGRPSFTRLRRISFGLLNQGGPRYGSGQLWFDELRATDVAKDVDHAQRVQINGQLANLMSYNLAWNGRGADFLSVGESRGSGSSQDQFSWSTAIQPHRFFEQTRIALPVSLGYSRNSSRPRFSAGDDIIRTGALEAASETRSETRSFATSYSRSWSERANPFLRYTLGGITAGYSWSESKSRSPYSVDSSIVKSATVSYLIAPRKLLSIGLPLGKARFFPLPERAYWNYAVMSNRAVAFDRVGAERDSLRLRNDVTGRSAVVDFGADTRPFDFFRHHIDGHRNLVLPQSDVRSDRIGFINLGRVTSWRQNMDARYSVTRGRWLQPSFSWNSSYNQNNGPELARDLSLRSVSNAQSMSMNLDLPFSRFEEANAARRSDRSARARPGTLSGGSHGGPPGDSHGAPPDRHQGAVPEGARGLPSDSVRAALPDSVRAALPDSLRAARSDTSRAARSDTSRAARSDTSRAARSDTSRAVAARPSPAGRRLLARLGGMQLRLSWRALLASLGTVSTDAGFGRSSAYTRLNGTPSFGYLFGFSSRLDSMRTPPAFGNSSAISTDWHLGAHTRMKLPFGSAANTRFDLSSRESDNNGMTNRTHNLRYPEIEMEYGQLASVLRLDRVLTSPVLHTTYNHSVITEFANNHRTATGRSSSTDWRPLIGLTGGLKNGAKIELKTERRVTETENLLVGHSVTTNRVTTTYFSINRSYSQGQKVKILGKEKTVSSTVTVGLTGQYEAHSGETVSYADSTRSQPIGTRSPIKESRLSLNGNGSYSFSTNVTGNVSLGYGQNNDRVKNFKRKNLRVELRAQFTF